METLFSILFPFVVVWVFGRITGLDVVLRNAHRAGQTPGTIGYWKQPRPRR